MTVLLDSVDVNGAARAAAASAVALLSPTCPVVLGRTDRGSVPLPRAFLLVTGAATQILLVPALGLLSAQATVEVMAGIGR